MKSNKPNIFLTSDWHDGHESVLSFCNRPFNDLRHMRSSLIKNFNATVPPGATTYFLGDVNFGPNDDFRKNVLAKLNPGTKILIVGNHDKGPYYKGFDAVLHSAYHRFGVLRFSMSHCPLWGFPREDTTGYKNGDPSENWHGEKRAKYLPFTMMHVRSDLHFHGHIHSPNGGNSQKIDWRQYDVGVDANNYRPVNIFKAYAEWKHFMKNRSIDE